MSSIPPNILSQILWRYRVQPIDTSWPKRNVAQRHQILLPRIWLLLVLLLTSVASACTNVMPGTVTSLDLLVEYWRSGGFAGLDDHLVISKDGHVKITRHDKSHEYDLGQEKLAQTRHLLDSIDFSSLDSSYEATGQGADLIEYKIWYDGHLIRATDTAIPADLVPLFEHLDGILSTTS
jgi:hypothetical protein